MHFILVHGVSHGAWSWYKIKNLLEDAGHNVSCPDLTSAGIDRANPDNIFNFQEYNQPLDDILDALSSDEKVILVGHSAGGLSLTKAIHNCPKKIKVAVFVAAIMLKYGFLTDEDKKDGTPDLSQYGDVYDFGYGHGRNNLPTSCIVKQEFAQKIVYQETPIPDYKLASMLLRPFPIRALASAKFPDDSEEIDSVPRVYIRTLNDNCLSLDKQMTMISRWPSPFYEVISDHCPMLSNPLELFRLLQIVAEKYKDA